MNNLQAIIESVIKDLERQGRPGALYIFIPFEEKPIHQDQDLEFTGFSRN